MLLRSSRSLIRSIPTVPAVCRIQPVRFRNDYGHNKNILGYRRPNWLGAPTLFTDVDAGNKKFRIPLRLKVENEHSVYLKNEEFKELLDVAYNVLRQSVTVNNFKYKQYANSDNYQHSSRRSIVRFANGLFENVDKYTGQDVEIKLENLISPTVDIIPAFAKKIIQQQNEDSLISKFFAKKGLSTPSDQLDYIFERVFHTIMHDQQISDIPGQDINVDISNPEEWYPEARRIRRKLILHMGPTNSGKTYHALQRLKESNDGYYAGPLRLLAREIYDKFQAQGVRCNLVTGEEVIEDRDESGIQAPLSSGTVEMIPMNQRFEVVVIDEIQMIADQFRGWAWTHALLGAQANEIHLCGEESVIPLIKKIAESTGDELIINRYERLGTLEIEKTPIRKGLKGLEKGDCIVAFSKKRIMAYKQEIQANTDLKCGVIYGALPAETRATEAERFNSGEYDVLVASDAVGMGLNLNINRVIFDAHKKFDGEGLALLESPQVKQIGGRAGRFKAPTANGERKASVGKITAFYADTLEFVREAMNTPTIFLEKADVWPSDTIWSLYTSTFPPHTRLHLLLDTFHQNVEDTEMYRISTLRDRLEVAYALQDSLKMLVADQLKMSTAPLSTALPKYRAVIQAFGSNVLHGFTKSILDFQFLKFDLLKLPATEDQLGKYEELHKYVLLFLWMQNRYPSFFVDRECAVELKNSLEEKIESVLRNKKHKRMGEQRSYSDDNINYKKANRNRGGKSKFHQSHFANQERFKRDGSNYNATRNKGWYNVNV